MSATSKQEPSPLSTWKRKYRVRPDSFAGWQSEVWTIWWPIWRQIGYTNTHFTREAAEEMCRLHADFRNL